MNYGGCFDTDTKNKRISELEKFDCKELAQEVLGLFSAEEVENKLKEFANKKIYKE